MVRVHAAAPVLFLLFLAVHPTWSQGPANSSPQPARDPRAVSAIQASLGSLGGAAEWSQIQDATEQGTCTDNLHNEATASLFTWMVRGLNFRYQSTGSDGEERVLVSGHGKPARSDGNTTVPISLHTATSILPYHLPGMVLARVLNDSAYSLHYIGTAMWNQTPAIRIDVTRTYWGRTTPGTEQRWYLNPTTMQPIAVSFLNPGDQDEIHYVRPAYTFSNYHTTDGISIPQSITTTIMHANYQQQCTINSIQLNTSPPDSSFDLPSISGGQTR